MSKSLFTCAVAVTYGVLGAMCMKIINDSYPPEVVTKQVIVEREVPVEKVVIRRIPITDDLACLASNIFHEARGESREGQVQVALVTMNRVASPQYPDTVCGVVYQKAQFSWTADDPIIDLGNAAERASYVQAMSIAQGVIDGEFEADNTGATHYYNAHKVNPSWAGKLSMVGIWGNHTFLR